MNFFNVYGLAAVAAMLIPNILFAVKGQKQAVWRDKEIETLEQIGRYACMIFMVFQIPYTYLGFLSEGAFVCYLAVLGGLVALYLLCWLIFWKRDGMAKAVCLSVLPSLLFLFCGALTLSLPLLMAALVFTPCHIYISCKGAALRQKQGREQADTFTKL